MFLESLLRGRGNLFLRHIERVGCIAYVVDLSGGQQEGHHPLLALPPAQQLRVLQVRMSVFFVDITTLFYVFARLFCQPMLCLETPMLAAVQFGSAPRLKA